MKLYLGKNKNKVKHDNQEKKCLSKRYEKKHRNQNQAQS